MAMKLLLGDCIDVLRGLDPGSVHTCVTSPPYYGLRDYGIDGQIGLEGTPEDYVARLVGVFREVRRVLRDDGTSWLNLGDTYNSTPSGPGLKPKDLIGIPWRVAFALQADGWYLRSDIIWHKPDPMPENVRDRPTRSHEYIFLMSKQASYYYDQDAIREENSPPDGGRQRAALRGTFDYRDSGHKPVEDVGFGSRNGGIYLSPINPDGRNKRSVWKVRTSHYTGAHFAVFPEELIRPCVLAGSPRDGVVLDPFCGTGTTGIVAWSYGRQFIGIDINTSYLEMAERRIDFERAKMPLMDSIGA